MVDDVASGESYVIERHGGQQDEGAGPRDFAPREEVDDSTESFTFDTDPVDLWAQFEPPELPRGVLPHEIEEYAFVQSEMIGADPSGFAMGALAVCAAAIPDRICVRVKKHDPNWTESPRLWVALVADPAGKKSPTITAVTRPARRIDTELHRDWQRKRAEFEKLTKDEQKAAEVPRQTRLCLEDTTVESAQEVLKDSPNGVLAIQDELSGWFGSMDKYAGSKGGAKDRGVWLQSFNGGPYAVNRINRGSSLIPNLSVSLVGGIQPDAIRKVAADSVDDGLLQRLFPIVLRPATLGVDAPRPNVVATYDALVHDLHRLQPPEEGGSNAADKWPVPLRFSDEAQKIRQEMERRHFGLMSFEAVNKKLASHVGKYDGLFARLCVIFHCIENRAGDTVPTVIRADAARRAGHLLHRFLLPHAMAFYSGVLGLTDGQEALAAIAAYILAHPELATITFRDLARGDRATQNIKRDDMQPLLERLEYLGWLEPTVPPRNGSAPRWKVNPRVHVLFAERGKKEAARREVDRQVLASIFGGAA